MPARIIDGNAIAAAIKKDLEGEISFLKSKGIIPGLAAILVGEHPASQIYVRSKVKACEALGIYSEKIELPATTTADELKRLVRELNHREAIDGILLQLPLPRPLDPKAILPLIDPAKDVDGFHPLSVGNLVTGRAGMVPCTPAGIMAILDRSGVPLSGARAVVVGRSDTVGKPTALLLLRKNSTVTICHSQTRDLARITREADVLVAAVGRAAMVTGEFIKPGATVIDVGIVRLTTEDEVRAIFHDPGPPMARLHARGSILVGDVQPEDAREVAGALTPVPGGVGPLTIAMLMSNTVCAARARRASKALREAQES